MSAGGAIPHTHDTDTLEFDAINSNGGAFSFATTGNVTFNQPIIVYTNYGEFGTQDAYSRNQIWWKPTDGVMRLGSLAADGDASNIVSNGLVIYGENTNGIQDANNYSFSYLEPEGLGLRNAVNGGYTGYIFKLHTTDNDFYIKDNSGNTTFEFDRANSKLAIGGSPLTNECDVGCLNDGVLALTETAYPWLILQ